MSLLKGPDVTPTHEVQPVDEKFGEKLKKDDDNNQKGASSIGQKLVLEIDSSDNLKFIETDFTESQYRRLLWKIDLCLLPLMWVGSKHVFVSTAKARHLLIIPME